ncbi:hypothetical protein [Lonsdalea quercina]|uniref:hypothetical protein n=1 Tax=Lonsdalea quercina TaxID=71657 RepID=UPI00397518C0
MSNKDRAVTADGTELFGNAATLYLASLDGGMDQHIQKRVDEELDAVALAAGRAVREEMRNKKKPVLGLIKGGKK